MNKRKIKELNDIILYDTDLKYLTVEDIITIKDHILTDVRYNCRKPVRKIAKGNNK